MTEYLDNLIRRHEPLYTTREALFQAFDVLKDVFSKSGTLFVCGNGGSGSDADHIVGELMKGFMLPRHNPSPVRARLEADFGPEGETLARELQEGLRAVSLLSHPALFTAFCNDVNPDLVFAQQLYVLGREGDVFLGLTTSGNSKNVVNALLTAKAKGIKTLIMTGQDGGKCAKLADVAIKAPSASTAFIQEYHVAIYHALCAELEAFFYGGK